MLRGRSFALNVITTRAVAPQNPYAAMVLGPITMIIRTLRRLNGRRIGTVVNRPAGIALVNP